MKTCNVCLLEKGTEEFYSRTRKTGHVYVMPRCKECEKAKVANWQKDNPDKVKQYTKATGYYKLDDEGKKDRNRRTSLKARYGITPDEYNAMLEEQDFSCAICRIHISEAADGLHVDHDHKTDVIRGLLCGKCNRGLGMYDDNVERILSAAAYLMERAG